jgi:nicotinate-nucleotide pyrophosphorylase (carboxylating)
MNHIDQLIKLALDEDIGAKDITTDAIVDPGLIANARITAKQELVIAGLDVAQRVFKMVDPSIEWDAKHEDGDFCEAKTILAAARGKAASLLTAERTALNFLQHLSGIATSTRVFVKAIADTKVKILDTRKTTPGMRALEKHAVLMGDGVNHRMGLYDRYLVKGNHIIIAGSITEAARRIQKKKIPGMLLEIETKTMEEVREALSCGADIIMLDNMPAAQVRVALSEIRGRAKVEVSGNITLENIMHYAATGVDFISVGAITHSAPAADIHMVLEMYQ